MAIDWKEMWVQTDKKLRETEMELFEVKHQIRMDTLIRETGNYLTTSEACEILDEEDRKAGEEHDRKMRESNPSWVSNDEFAAALFEVRQ